MCSMIMVYATMMQCWKDGCKTSVNLKLYGIERLTDKFIEKKRIS